MRKQDKDRQIKVSPGQALLLFLPACLLIVMLSFSNSGQNLENSALDLFYRLRPASPPPSELLLVAIDEASFQELRRPWPWPRSLHAQLINRLAAAGARFIIFDVLFAEPSNPEDDQSLAQAMLKAGNVILACTMDNLISSHSGRQTLIEPLEIFSLAAYGVALFMACPDDDGIVRRFRLREGTLDTMPALVLRGMRPQVSLPPDLSGLIRYVGGPGSIEVVSYHQLMDQNQALPADRIRGRLVLVGRMLETPIDPLAKIDAFYTPFFKNGRLYMSGVEIQANILHTLLQGDWGRELPKVQWLTFCGLGFFIFSLFCVRLTPLGGLTVLGGFLAGLWGITAYLFLVKNVYLPPVLLSLGFIIIYGEKTLDFFVKEMREKRWLRNAFARYVSPEVVEAIVDHPEGLELGGTEREVTILFSDVADFTTVSENLLPQKLVQVMNEYFETLTQIILQEKGTVDKYIGDAVMCFWGAPIPMPDHALRACRAALAIQEALQELRKNQTARRIPPLKARIGIHSGLVVVGNFGSRERFNYTIMGDNVNLASRLEQANKHYGTKIIISFPTSLSARDRFLLRELDNVRVKGRRQSEIVYELLGPCPVEGPPDWLHLWAEGLSAYRGREWEVAGRLFSAVLRMKPEDIPAKSYLEECQHYLQNPPPSNWQGIHSLTGK
jgi:adenylate cyclase